MGFAVKKLLGRPGGLIQCPFGLSLGVSTLAGLEGPSSLFFSCIFSHALPCYFGHVL
jgi:hypothetical protein